MEVLYALIFLVVGFGLNEFAHRARRIQDGETIANLLNMTYLRLGYRPEKKESAPISKGSAESVVKTTMDSRAELAPPSIDAMRDEAFARQMTK